MTRILILLVLALGLSPLPSAKAACFADRRVVAVNIGYVDGSRGPDGGYAVYFQLDDSPSRWWALNNGYNLNDEGRGPALHKTLLMAMASGYKIRAYDNYGYTCDDIDVIHMYR